MLKRVVFQGNYITTNIIEIMYIHKEKREDNTAMILKTKNHTSLILVIKKKTRTLFRIEKNESVKYVLVRKTKL